MFQQILHVLKFVLLEKKQEKFQELDLNKAVLSRPASALNESQHKWDTMHTGKT